MRDACHVAQVLAPFDQGDERSSQATELFLQGVLEGVAKVIERSGRQQADGVAGGPGELRRGLARIDRHV